RRVMPVVAVALSLLIHENVLPGAEGVKELDLQICQQLVHRRLVGRNPLPSELIGLAANLGVPGAAADAIPRFEHEDLAARGGQLGGRGQPRDTSSDNNDLAFDPACCRADLAETLRDPAHAETGSRSRSASM